MRDERKDTAGEPVSWLETVARGAHVAMGVARLADGALVDVNDALCRLLQGSRDEIIGRSAADLAFWVDPDQCARLRERLNREGAVGGFAARYRGLRGECGEVELSASVVERDDGPYVVGLMVEVSQQREIVDGLRAAQTRLDLALRASGMLVFRQDRELRYTWVANPVLGARAAEVIGRTDDELLGVEAAAPLVAIKRRVLETGQAERRDVWVAHQGRLGCFDLVVEPERDDAAQVGGIICAATDITHRVTSAPSPAPARRPDLQAVEGMAALLGREAWSPRQAQRLARIGRAARPVDAGSALAGADALAALRRHHAGTPVVVAEEGPVQCELLVALLESAALQVTAVAGAAEAFRAVLHAQPALLLLDMELPQRGVISAVMAPRATLRWRLPIFAMLSPGSPVESADALDADADDLVDKPVKADLSYPKVLSCLGTR